jgi:hypothetical protein
VNLNHYAKAKTAGGRASAGAGAAGHGVAWPKAVGGGSNPDPPELHGFPGATMATDPTPEPRAEQTHPHQAQAVIAAAILRQLHAVVITGRRWDPAIATHGTRQLVAAATAA